MTELLRVLLDPVSAREDGLVDTSSSSEHDVEAMEISWKAIYGTTVAGGEQRSCSIDGR